MNGELLLSEKYGSLGYGSNYYRGERKIVRRPNTTSLPLSIWYRCANVVRDVFLPYGYPDCVSKDYLNYQIWDTLQAFCSTITGTFTTQAILQSVGVGNSEATPLAAAITWVLKDGSGMIGRIVFAWWKGSCLDSDCKKWRLFADGLNDLAMHLELAAPLINSNYTLHLLCATTTMKAIVGVAGGASRATITHHQAIRGNMADLSAKDGSQETCVNLIASFLGVFLLSTVAQNLQLLTVMLFTALHLYANYRAVKSLVFTSLNSARFNLLLADYLKNETVHSPEFINDQESVLLGCGLQARHVCGFNIVLASSLQKSLAKLKSTVIADIIQKYRNKNYLIIPDVESETMYVAFKNIAGSSDMMRAYINAIILGILTSIYNHSTLDICSKKHLHKSKPITRVQDLLKDAEKNLAGTAKPIPNEYLEDFREVIDLEITRFCTAISLKGWNIDNHSLDVGEWRCEWKPKDLELKKQN